MGLPFRAWAPAALLLLAAPPAVAQSEAAEGPVAGYQSAGALGQLCTDSSSYGQGYCFAYIAAVADAVRAYQAWLGLKDVCLPARVSQGRLRDVFVDYLTANPSLGGDQAASIIVLALQAQFPCAAERAAPRR